ncbi:zinc knuckle family protein [Perilla frutescens var. hirtella]|nr:zinc knuckle family protein [Perilla frutescens var. hirtella]
MYSATACSSSLRVMAMAIAIIPQSQLRYNHNKLRYWIMPHSRRKLSFVSSPISSSSTTDDNSALSKHPQLGYDPSEDLFGLAVDLQPRKVASAASKPGSWIGPNGQYFRESPCPSCRGRGYTPCTECGIERSRPDCSLCSGKGLVTCNQCHGDCVIWEEWIDERPWEKARSVSPLKVKEDDEVDNLDIKLEGTRKTKRVYQSSAPEVNLKISRSLKSLNAKTGIFSKRMKIIHQDPMLHAQRVAAIKKTKGTAAARKRASEVMKIYFSDPENRRKRSIAMKGIKYYCRNCGREGHRRNYCPELQAKAIDSRFRCRLCGEKGHNRRTCPKLKSNDKKILVRRDHCCNVCGQSGHNRRTCPQVPKVESTASVTEGVAVSRRNYTCRLCQEKGHNARTCPQRR